MPIYDNDVYDYENCISLKYSIEDYKKAIFEEMVAIKAESPLYLKLREMSMKNSFVSVCSFNQSIEVP